MTEGRKSTFMQMCPGDLVLFVPKETGEFRYRGAVLFTFRHSSLGRDLWPFVPGEDWTLIYLLVDVRRISVPKHRLLRELGYAENYVGILSKVVDREA